MNNNSERDTWLQNNDTDQNANKQQPKDKDHGAGFNPVITNCVAYFGAAVFFLIGFNVAVLPELPPPSIGSLLPESLLNYWQETAVLPLLLWGIHYTKRFAECLFVHIYYRKMSCVEAYGASIYYWGFGLWIGWAMNFHLGYLTPHPGIFYPGLVLFVTGMLGNLYCHIRLRQMRERQPDHTKVIPRGMFFDSVSCPHYSFEVLTWLGFSICSFTLAAFVFFLATFLVLLLYSTKKHNAYTKMFNGRERGVSYPVERKILIPLIY